MPFNIGFPELIMILAVALIVFGPRKLPEVGRSIGRAMGEFRRASHELKTSLEEDIDSEKGVRTVSKEPPAASVPSFTTQGIETERPMPAPQDQARAGAASSSAKTDET